MNPLGIQLRKLLIDREYKFITFIYDQFPTGLFINNSYGKGRIEQPSFTELIWTIHSSDEINSQTGFSCLAVLLTQITQIITYFDHFLNTD